MEFQKDLIVVTVKLLNESKKTLAYGKLNDFLRSLGGGFGNNRGLARYIKALYEEYKRKGDSETAEKIALAFTKKNGKYAWE